MNPQRIGDLSRDSGVNIETIRYYERIGLLAKPQRASNGYRSYDNNAVKSLKFIRRGRELGFAIAEIKTLLSLADHPNQPCKQADQLARNHLDAVNAKIEDLLAMRDVLGQLTACDSPTAAHCRLLETLDNRDCCGEKS